MHTTYSNPSLQNQSKNNHLVRKAPLSQRTTRPQNPPEQDWSKYTKEYEQDESFWTEYERKFWENYGKFTDKNKGNAKMQDEDEISLFFTDEKLVLAGTYAIEPLRSGIFSFIFTLNGIFLLLPEYVMRLPVPPVTMSICPDVCACIFVLAPLWNFTCKTSASFGFGVPEIICSDALPVK